MSQDPRQVLEAYDRAEQALRRHELEWWCAPPNRQAAVHAVAGGAEEHQELVEAVEALDAARELPTRELATRELVESNQELRPNQPLEKLLKDLNQVRS